MEPVDALNTGQVPALGDFPQLKELFYLKMPSSFQTNVSGNAQSFFLFALIAGVEGVHDNIMFFGFEPSDL